MLQYAFWRAEKIGLVDLSYPPRSGNKVLSTRELRSVISYDNAGLKDLIIHLNTQQVQRQTHKKDRQQWDFVYSIEETIFMAIDQFWIHRCYIL